MPNTNNSSEKKCLPITRALWKPYCDKAVSMANYIGSEESKNDGFSSRACCGPCQIVGTITATALWLTATPFALVIDCGVSLKDKCTDCNNYEKFPEKPESQQMKC